MPSRVKIVRSSCLVCSQIARGFTMDDFDKSQSRTHPVRGGRQGEAEKQLKAKAAPEEPCHHSKTRRGLSVEPAVLITSLPLLRRKSSRCLKEDGLSSQVLESGWFWRLNRPVFGVWMCQDVKWPWWATGATYTQILSNFDASENLACRAPGTLQKQPLEEMVETCSTLVLLPKSLPIEQCVAGPLKLW